MSLDNKYKVLTHPDLQKSIDKNLPSNLRKVFDKKVKYLSSNIKHPSLNTKPYHVSEQKLKQLGVDKVFEFYINMSFRCMFYVQNDEKQIILTFVGNHKQVKTKYS